MGFETGKFVPEVEKDKQCLLCHLVLDNPIKTPCGHLFCSGCILPWVVKHEKCPLSCQIIKTSDLENELHLRELILNSTVRCEYRNRGCPKIVRLLDLETHTKLCEFRPVKCPNLGCLALVCFRELEKHRTSDCNFHNAVVCGNGCGLPLLPDLLETHQCVPTLRSQIAIYENHINAMECEMTKMSLQFNKRENYFLHHFASLHRELRLQTLYFRKRMVQCQNTELQKCSEPNLTEDLKKLTFHLTRENKSLGVNIMGGYMPEKNNNEQKTVTDFKNESNGIIVSRVVNGSPAAKVGMKVKDLVVSVNGQDLSQSSHDEAVEAFRTAKEPIVVEVLRRENKNKMKSRTPTMVSIGTQTEEEIYGFIRPPTPPMYGLNSTILCQPASRRPVAFSPSADMGLTDIEMAHGLEYDDAYFEERPYEIEYEEVVLHRSSNSEKLGLTLCYGSLEDEVTDIFISEVESCSIAAQDGRIREGDQILQINGIDVHSRDQAIKLFSERTSDIVLLLARPATQMDDGFIEDQNVLDQLQMDFLEKHHHDNMQIMASMLARGHLIDEEGGTTDTATTENSLHKHEKDSGVGRTDESTKNDESSELDTFDTECTNSPAATSKFRQGRGEYHHSDESFMSHDITDQEINVNDISKDECDKFREVLVQRCDSRSSNNSPKKGSSRKNSSNLEREIDVVNREMENIQIECQDLYNNHIGEDIGVNHIYETLPSRSPRVVPRMGTRLEYVKNVQLNNSGDAWNRSDNPVKKQQKAFSEASTTSAYNTGESCRSTPLTLELNQLSDDSEKGFKNSMLCLASTTTTPLASTSDTEKQTQTPCQNKESSSEELNVLSVKNNNEKTNLSQEQKMMGESLQDLYMSYADVMYTNEANLQHTIAIQQKLFQQQMEQKCRRRNVSLPSSNSSMVTVEQNKNVQPKIDNQQSPNCTPPDSGQMEWVVKRRPDGSRYITRRPIRNKMLKERAKKISEERCGMTTDDDAMSEMKHGRYWSKEDRKRHVEKARDHKKKRELMMKAKMETLKEHEEKKDVNILELSHRKMMKNKGRKVFDDFVTIQEMLAHGSRHAEGKTYNPLLSVTTV